MRCRRTALFSSAAWWMGSVRCMSVARLVRPAMFVVVDVNNRKHTRDGAWRGWDNSASGSRHVDRRICVRSRTWRAYDTLKWRMLCRLPLGYLGARLPVILGAGRPVSAQRLCTADRLKLSSMM